MAQSNTKELEIVTCMAHPLFCWAWHPLLSYFSPQSQLREHGTSKNHITMLGVARVPLGFGGAGAGSGAGRPASGTPPYLLLFYRVLPIGKCWASQQSASYLEQHKINHFHIASQQYYKSVAVHFTVRLAPEHNPPITVNVFRYINWARKFIRQSWCFHWHYWQKLSWCFSFLFIPK